MRASRRWRRGWRLREGGSCELVRPVMHELGMLVWRGMRVLRFMP